VWSNSFTTAWSWAFAARASSSGECEEALYWREVLAVVVAEPLRRRLICLGGGEVAGVGLGSSVSSGSR
jgi:hypothetical protein